MAVVDDNERLIELDDRKKYFDRHTYCKEEDFKLIVERFYDNASPEEIDKVEEIIHTLDELKETFSQYLPKFRKKSGQFIKDLKNLTKKHYNLFDDGNSYTCEGNKQIQSDLKDAMCRTELVAREIEGLGEKVKNEYHCVGKLLWNYMPESERKSWSWPWESNLWMYQQGVEGLSQNIQNLSENLEAMK